MTFTSTYATPAAFDNLLMTSDGKVLTGLHFVKAHSAVEPNNALPIFKDGRVIAALGVLWPDENRKQDVRRLKQLHQFQKEANELLSGKNLWYNIGNEV